MILVANQMVYFKGALLKTGTERNIPERGGMTPE